MAYHLHHILSWNNKITQNCVIEMYRKDVVPDEVVNLKLIRCEKSFSKGDSDGSAIILSTSFDFTFELRNTTLSWEDFVISFYDEWKIIFKVDDQIHFIGFATPGEGDASFLAQPYDVQISCTDGLGLLKGVNLLQQDGTEFRGMYRVIDYLAAALYRTSLNLNIRLYSNIYESSFDDRYTDPNSDTFNNAKQDFRTYQSSATSFYDCYTVLERMLGEGYRLFQWQDKWVVLRYAEMQESEGPKLWYTEYDYQTNVLDAQQELNGAAFIMKQQVLHHINANQRIGSNFSVKSAKHTYNYETYPELPLNNKFERGTLFLPYSDATHNAYLINDWTFGRTDPGSPSTFPPTMAATSDRAYRYSTINAFGIETSREIILENDGNPGHRFLMCTPFHVKQGDKVNIGFDFKFDPGGSGTKQICYIFIVPDAGGLKWTLDSGNTPDSLPLTWLHSSALTFVSKSYVGEDWGNYSSFNLELPEAPATGMFYFCMLNFDSTNTRAYFKNFSLEYLPFVANGYVQVKGDYWKTLQNTDYKDVIDAEVFMSDSTVFVLKGALYRSDGVTLTTRTWHRLNVAENRDFKELVNLGRYNQQYRRMWHITGNIGGTTFNPENDGLITEPLGFHRHFKFPYEPRLDNKLFELVPPLSIDYVDGSFSGVFREVLDTSTNDGNDDGDSHTFNYNFG